MILIEPIAYGNGNHKGHLFEQAYTIRSTIEPEYIGTEPEIVEFIKWLYASFKFNFILLEKRAIRLAGGYTDNVQGSKYIEHDLRDKESMLEGYELRCSTYDSIVLTLKYKREGVVE